jgi:hypothetical protein
MVPCEFKLKIDGEALEDFEAKATHSELSIMLLFSIQSTTMVDDHLSLNSAARRRKVLKLGVLFVISRFDSSFSSSEFFPTESYPTSRKRYII